MPVQITEAGLQAAINDTATGFSGLMLASVDLLDKQGDKKKTLTLAGVELITPERIYVAATDSSEDAYDVYSMTFVTDKGVEFCTVFNEDGSVIQAKAKQSALMLAYTIVLSEAPGSIAPSGDLSLYAPPASEDKLGTVELATQAEVDAGIDTTRAIVPARLKDWWTKNEPAAAPVEVHPGTIVMFAGTEEQIPKGWQLCNGQGKTSNGIAVPNLQNRFVVGAGNNYSPGSTGGKTSTTTASGGSHSHSVTVSAHTLTEGEMPSHKHDSGWGESVPEWASFGYINRRGTGSGKSDGDNLGYLTNWCGSSSAHSHGASSGSSGSHSHGVSITPPYYALCLIIKL